MEASAHCTSLQHAASIDTDSAIMTCMITTVERFHVVYSSTSLLTLAVVIVVEQTWDRHYSTTILMYPKKCCGKPLA